MFIMKISDTIIKNVSGNILTNYPDRKIEFLGLTVLSSTTTPGFLWRMEPTSLDGVSKKPLKEEITTKDGKTIKCVVFKISYVGSTTISQQTNMNYREFYLRIYNANVTISKVFLVIIAEDISEVAKIEFVTEKNANEIDQSEKFSILDKNLTTVEDAINFNLLNKTFTINEDFNQFKTCIFKIFIQQTTGANIKPVAISLQDYSTLNTTDKGQEDNTPNSKPTFADFISIYQDLIKSDPEAEAQKWENLIDKEKELQAKYKNALDEFKKYITNFNQNLNDYTTKISDITDK